MANVQTHLHVGALVCGAAVVLLAGEGLITAENAFVLFALGVIGSLLPDIDAAASAPVRGAFAVLAAALAFALILPLAGRHPGWELAVAWIGFFVVVRLLLAEAFARFTVHRGVWHSLAAAAAVGLGTVNLAHWQIGQSAGLAWVAGAMVSIGYLTHLVLDELFSVDLFNTRIRRSFGTALKLISWSNPWGSLLMLASVAGLGWSAPLPDWPLTLPTASFDGWP